MTTFPRTQTVLTRMLVPSVAVLFVVTGCRSKLDVKTKSGGEAPPAADSGATDAVAPGEQPDAGQGESDTGTEGEGGDGTGADGGGGPAAAPVEKKSSLFIEGDRQYFQSRDTITLKIKREVVDGADSFSVLNTTQADSDDSKAIVLVDHDQVEFGLRSAAGYALADTEGDFVVLRFFPGADQWKSKFFFDKDKPNMLKVVAHDPLNPRYSTIQVHLRDFAVFGVALTAFDDDVQVAPVSGPESGFFQGWVNTVAAPAVKAADGTVLVHGMTNIINPH